ncbi:MAG TPA: hypothetical protein VGI92_09005 [Gemmatimonadales bacterium]|jgi:hypothetical protein
MLCELCASVGKMRVGEAQDLNRRQSTELLSITCDCCGEPLGTTTGDRRVTKTLTLLARFGLVGEHILARRRA